MKIVDFRQSLKPAFAFFLRKSGCERVTLDEVLEAGKAWIGDGAKVASDGKTLISKDGLRQFRPPSFKPKLGRTQANFERRNLSEGQWQGNGHLDIIK